MANLRNALANLYGDEASTRRVSDDAGLDARRIHFNTTASNFWHAILTKAVRSEKLDALLDGSFYDNSDFVRCAVRGRPEALYRSRGIGFRCASPGL